MTQLERQPKSPLPHLDADQFYRLPTTNEWFALSAGESLNTNGGNFSGAEVQSSNWPPPWPFLNNHPDGFARTAPVYSAEFNPSESGFYHLAGNAAEWCAEQVLCGGSWCDGETNHVGEPNFQLIERVPLPAQRHDRHGFRVFLEELPQPQANSKSAP